MRVLRENEEVAARLREERPLPSESVFTEEKL
jgi:hypothetical protein